MEFTRIRKRGRTQKTYREWKSDCGHYRIIWRSEAFGVELPPRFYATVLTCGVEPLFKPWWNFVDRRGPYKTFKKAVEDCERSKKLWGAFIELGEASGHRAERLRTLVNRSKLTFSSLPVWVHPQADPVLLRMLFPCAKDQNDQSDRIETSMSSDDGESPVTTQQNEMTEGSGPVSPVKEKGGSTETRITTASKDSSSPHDSGVNAAKEPVKAREKQSSRSTGKQSTGGKQKKPSGVRKKPSGKAASRNSRKKKGKR